MALLVLGSVIASLYGLVFYVVVGHGRLRLIGYWLVALVGFGAGHFIAGMLGLGIANIGELRIVEGTLVSFTSLFAARAWWR
ncbi:MAG: hypothetical protein HY868_02040 [Chloroflexi bacterium]|nr:hypothetical protein [Chloroflexota bacterium]